MAPEIAPKQQGQELMDNCSTFLPSGPTFLTGPQSSPLGRSSSHSQCIVPIACLTSLLPDWGFLESPAILTMAILSWPNLPLLTNAEPCKFPLPHFPASHLVCIYYAATNQPPLITCLPWSPPSELLCSLERLKASSTTFSR